MHKCKYIYILILVFACSGLTAQTLQGLQENPVIKKYLAEHPAKLKTASASLLLSLPFFEDFSVLSVFPDPAKWTDRDAFINATFAIDPVSLGVATLDAIDENGDVYALTSLPVSSDKLTSQEIDLSPYGAPADTVRLSFFYQSGGHGEVPELIDSLLLDFFSPVVNQWKTGWYAIKNVSTEFTQVILDVPPEYYQNGFRFRFRNYTSISENDVSGGKGALSNADCWNIDYIMMNTEPVSTHKSFNDIALVDPPGRLLSFYEIIPWLHLNEAQSITRNVMNYAIHNLNHEITVNVGRNYFMNDKQTGKVEFYEEFFEQFGPDTVVHIKDPFYAPFTRSDNSSEGTFEVGSYLITPAGQFKQNDSAKITMIFKDFYAYDDGTPEYGFGIAGPSMTGALLAYRFRLYKPDTLRALDMLFNRARDNFNASLKFQLCVWKDDGGRPGELLFMSDDQFSPNNGNTMPGFKRYVISSEEDLIINDTSVFVGWKQLTDEFLNLGFDVNRNNLDRVFVNVSGDWINPGGSIIPGSIMIRAVFGSKDVVTGDDEIPFDDTGVVLFPNPVSGILTIEPNGEVIRGIALYDLAGRLVIQQTYNQNFVDVSDLAPGIYQLLLTTDKDQRIIRKIIVSH